jgi:hypothetical protein
MRQEVDRATQPGFRNRCTIKRCMYPFSMHKQHVLTLQKPRDGQDVDSFEAQWQSATESFLMENDVATLQCLVLAQIFCLLRADYSRMLKYKGLAVGLSQRLGLHQSQKRFALGALTSETRKKVFWSLYTVDW